jgi:hypothetical protein
VSRITLKTYSTDAMVEAFEESQKLLTDGKKAPFPDAYCAGYSSHETVHLIYKRQLIGFASLNWTETCGDLWKFYIHPTWRAEGLGREGAVLIIDHLFAKSGIEQVTLEMTGDTSGFWNSVTERYPDRSFCGLTHCYFVGPGLTALGTFPWIAD